MAINLHTGDTSFPFPYHFLHEERAKHILPPSRDPNKINGLALKPKLLLIPLNFYPLQLHSLTPPTCLTSRFKTTNSISQPLLPIIWNRYGTQLVLPSQRSRQLWPQFRGAVKVLLRNHRLMPMTFVGTAPSTCWRC
ncbi:hypothetical protein CR513_60390, partial [Mucuna pruriens]